MYACVRAGFGNRCEPELPQPAIAGGCPKRVVMIWCQRLETNAVPFENDRTRLDHAPPPGLVPPGSAGKAIVPFRISAQGTKPAFWSVFREATLSGLQRAHGDGAELVGDPLQLLNDVQAETPPPERLRHFHVDVRVGRIVMEHEAALCGRRRIGPTDMQLPFGAALPLFDALPTSRRPA